MKIKLLQLNMWAGTHFSTIKTFLERNDFDILCFQEVAGKDTRCGNVHATIDCYESLQEVLGKTHKGKQLKTDIFTSNLQTSYQGIAIFYKNDFFLKKSEPVILYKHEGIYPSDAKSYEDMTRGFLHLALEKDGKILNLLTAHLAWATTKEEQPHQREQNLKLIEYVKDLETPWILTGDFNIDPDQQTILDLEKLGRDLTKEYNVTNTVDSVNHVHWERMKPGFSIDYIFTSNDIQVLSFKALDTVHMSDHLGLFAEVEI